MHDFSSAAASHDKRSCKKTIATACMSNFEALMRFWAGRPLRACRRSLEGRGAHAAHERTLNLRSSKPVLYSRCRNNESQSFRRWTRYSHQSKGRRSGRNPSLASIWRDQVRVRRTEHPAGHPGPFASGQLAHSRDLIVSCCESTRYVSSRRSCKRARQLSMILFADSN